MGYVCCIFFFVTEEVIFSFKNDFKLKGLFFSQEIGSAAIMTREEDLCRLVCTYTIFLLFFGTDNHKI